VFWCLQDNFWATKMNLKVRSHPAGRAAERVSFTDMPHDSCMWMQQHQYPQQTQQL
jgi:hypothetical protein